MGTGFFKPSLRKQGFFLPTGQQLLKIGVCMVGLGRLFRGSSAIGIGSSES